MIELYWKTLTRMLEEEGVRSGTPRETIRAAFAAGWLDDEERWLDLLKDRNLTSHTYQEPLALEIYRRIPAHHRAMRTVYGKLCALLPS